MPHPLLPQPSFACLIHLCHAATNHHPMPIRHKKYLENGPKNRHHTTPISTSLVSSPRRTHDPCQNSSPWERDVMTDEREKGRCGERKEMRNRGENKVRERVRYVNKKILFVLQLSYSAILNVEWHCSTIANFFCNSSFLQVRMQRLFWAFMLNKSNI